MSDKSDALVAEFGTENVYRPDLPTDPLAVIAKVNGYLEKQSGRKIIFVGTSLGGFYANYFAQKRNSQCVLINPCTRPSSTLAPIRGIVQPNYRTGADVVIQEEHLSKFCELELQMLNTKESLVSLFLATNDEIIDPVITKIDLPSCRSTIEFQTGGHRFSDNWQEVVEYIKELANIT